MGGNGARLGGFGGAMDFGGREVHRHRAELVAQLRTGPMERGDRRERRSTKGTENKDSRRGRCHGR